MKVGLRDRSWPILSVVTRQLFLAVLVVGAPPACTKPFVLDGDANYARITYAGDMERATAAAKRHCAPYERVPQFREIEESVVYFDCVRP
jgi:hypothetical protein